MIIFLDIDGTYAHWGNVPTAHVEAVRAARRQGHRVLLCTGRARAMVPDRLLAAGFDGIVASGGTYVEIEESVIHDEVFPTVLAERTINALQTHRAVFVLEGTKVLIAPIGSNSAIKRIFAHHNGLGGHVPNGVPDFLSRVVERESLAGTRFGKVTVLESAVPIEHIGREIGEGVATLQNSIPQSALNGAGEIFMPHLTKSVGAERAARALGFTRNEAIAVGDGYNDIDLLSWASIGVAIEGGPAELMAVADRTARGPADSGLSMLFQDLGLVPAEALPSVSQFPGSPKGAAAS